jgi:hypothetical protein
LHFAISDILFVYKQYKLHQSFDSCSQFADYNKCVSIKSLRDDLFLSM